MNRRSFAFSIPFAISSAAGEILPLDSARNTSVAGDVFEKLFRAGIREPSPEMIPEWAQYEWSFVIAKLAPNVLCQPTEFLTGFCYKNISNGAKTCSLTHSRCKPDVSNGGFYEFSGSRVLIYDTALLDKQILDATNKPSRHEDGGNLAIAWWGLSKEHNNAALVSSIGQSDIAIYFRVLFDYLLKEFQSCVKEVDKEKALLKRESEQNLDPNQ